MRSPWSPQPVARIASLVMRRPDHPLRKTIAPVLTVCLSVCCCQGQLLAQGASDTERQATRRSGDTGAACCPGRGDERPDDAPRDQDPAPPLKACKAYCIKGTGLRNAGLTLAIATVDAAPIAAMPAAFVHVRDRGHHRPPGLNAAKRRVAPPTLLRLHCAMLV